MKRMLAGLGLSVIVLLVGACSNEEEYSFGEVKNEEVSHIHGSGYINGGDEYVIATHWGLYAYEDEWKESTKEKHDYMGFSPVKDGFYSSGHPEITSDYKNPLGLIKSEDKGESFEQLAFYGVTDFHHLAAGYETNTIYVVNEMPNEKIGSGLYYTEDEGQNWIQPQASNLPSEGIISIAAHPTVKGTVAVATVEGLYNSNDYGNTFKRHGDPVTVSAITLTKDGGLYATVEKSGVNLQAFNSTEGKETQMGLPNLSAENPIIQLAVNPNNVSEISFVTLDLSIYQTKDNGKSWTMLADKGKLK